MVNIYVQLEACPAGFALSSSSGSCVCAFGFTGYNIKCNINELSFEIPPNSWLGFIADSQGYIMAVFAPNFPTGYCTSRVVKITLYTYDGLCESHRTGLLCGECPDGYSLTLGNGMCAKCSNTYLLLLFPLAVAGLLLVVVLFALNLTVTEGSINAWSPVLCQCPEHELHSTVNKRRKLGLHVSCLA